MSRGQRPPLCSDCSRVSVASRQMRVKSHQRYGCPLCPACYDRRLQLAAGQQAMRGTDVDVIEIDDPLMDKVAGRKKKFEISPLRFVKIHHDRKQNEWLVVHRDGEALFKLRKEEVPDTLSSAVEARLVRVICGGCGVRLLKGEYTVCGNCEGTAVERLLGLRERLADG